MWGPRWANLDWCNKVDKAAQELSVRSTISSSMPQGGITSTQDGVSCSSSNYSLQQASSVLSHLMSQVEPTAASAEEAARKSNVTPSDSSLDLIGATQVLRKVCKPIWHHR